MATAFLDRDRLRAARVLFVALVGLTTVMYLASGQSLLPSAGFGFVHGGFAFLGVVLLYLVYLGAKPALAQES